MNKKDLKVGNYFRYKKGKIIFILKLVSITNKDFSIYPLQFMQVRNDGQIHYWYKNYDKSSLINMKKVERKEAFLEIL